MVKKIEVRFNPDDIREIYHVSRLQKQLRGARVIFPLLGIVASVIAAFFLLGADLNDRGFLLTTVCLLAIYFGSLFWKNYKAPREAIQSVENFIEKNEKFKRNFLTVDGNFLELEQDEFRHRYNLREVITIQIKPNCIHFKFREDALIFPKNAFHLNDWNDFLEQIRRHEKIEP